MRALLGCLVLPLLSACAVASTSDETETGEAASSLGSEAVVDGRFDVQSSGALGRLGRVGRISVINPPPPPPPPIGRANEIEQVARISVPNPPPPPPPPIGRE